MSSNKKRKYYSYKDSIQSSDLLTLSEIRTIYKDYKHDQVERFEMNITLHDVGCIFYLIYLKSKYNCHVSISENEMIEISLNHNSILEWLEELDYYVDDEIHRKFLIYFKNKEFYYDPNIIQMNCSQLQIHLVSHTFPFGSGHIGAILIQENKCYYFDSNGLKDSDDPFYYNDFFEKLNMEMKKYQIEFVPFYWKRGIQCYQECENDRYRINMIGMCCSWSFYILELKLLNPKLSMEDIENSIKKRYRNRLTRMISTYQQRIHKILWNIAKDIYLKFYSSNKNNV
jgi:hypothetical protein